MNIIKNIGWLLWDSLVWIAKYFVYLIKKIIKQIIKQIKKLFSRENFRENKLKMITSFILIVAIFFSGWYVFKNYKFAIISKNEKKQTVAERNFLNALNMEKQVNGKLGIKPTPKIPSRAAVIRGKIKEVTANKLVIIMDNQEEQSVTLNERTRTMPLDKKAEIGQVVMAYVHDENNETVVDRLTIR
jgi:hypothetical protein